MWRSLLPFPLLAATLSAQVPQPNADERSKHIDGLFARMALPGSPGAAVTVIEKSRIVHSAGYGDANLEYGIEITPRTVFHVASISKQFTAFAVVLLEQRGKLSLDDDVRKHLPLVPDFGEPITLRQLAYHTSGLRDQWGSLAIAGWRLDDVITTAHILDFVRHQRELNFAPGTRHLYCNTGYTLLAEVVARVSSSSFPDFTADNVFRPLGMKNTHFHDDHERIVANRAYSYKNVGGRWKRSVLSYANAGATSLFTTSEDLARWLHNFADAKVGGPKAIARLQERGKLKNGRTLNYALGLNHGRQHGLATLSHGGSDAGFRSMAIWFPDKQLGVCVLGNFAECPASELARRVAGIWLQRPAPAETARARPPATREPPAVAVPAAILDRYVGRWLVDGQMAVRVWRDGKSLKVQAMNQPPGMLIARSETEFALAMPPARMRFHVDENGRATRAVIQVLGRRMRAVPAPAGLDSKERLAEFVGTYASDELDARYRIALDGGRLVARHRRHGTIELTPITKDSFVGNRRFFGRIVFERADDGRITGCKLSTRRVWNLWFRRS